MNPTYKYSEQQNIMDWNKFYKDLKFTVRCIPAFLKPLNDKIKFKLIKTRIV